VKDVAQFLKVLADEFRLQILWLLFNYEELCVCDLVEALGVCQSKVSRHLATLRHMGLVTDRKDGAWSFYSLRLTSNEFERAVLDVLRKKLAGYPGAVRVLQDIHIWMKNKRRDVSCVSGGPSSSKKRSKRAGRSRKPSIGDKK